MLASVYVDDFERGNAMGIALGGLALGVLSKENNRVHINSISRALLATTHTQAAGSAPSWQHYTSMAGLSSSLPLLTLHSHCPQDLPITSTKHPSGDPETAMTAGAECCCLGTGDGGTAAG